MLVKIKKLHFAGRKELALDILKCYTGQVPSD